MAADTSPDRLADHFINYVFDDYSGDSLHVRRVASWIGMLALGIESVKDSWKFSHNRQLIFEAGNKRYKVKYDHAIKPRGGLAIIEVDKTPGSPELATVHAFSNLQDVQAFYDNPTL